MSETTLVTAQVSEQPDLSKVKIRMDKSRAHATIHGVRPPGDPHHRCHFIQDGLYYDAEGHLIIQHDDYLDDTPEGEKKRQMLERKLKRHLSDMAKKSAAVTAPGGPDHPRGIDVIEDDGDDEDDGDLLEPINLEEWIRGRQQVEWNDVSQTIAQRYKRRVASIADAIPFLVTEGLVPADQVAKKFKKFLD